MSARKLIVKLLRLGRILRVLDFWFKVRAAEIHLLVKPYKNGGRCPECGRRGVILRKMREVRTWRDIRVCGWAVFFHYCPREIKCPTHGRIQEEIPWADRYARVTYRLEFLVLVHSQLMTQKAAAEVLRLPRSTFSDILHRSITRLRDGHRIRGLKSIGIDEVSYKKGHKYVTVVYDLDRSRVVWVGEGKGRDTIDEFFDTRLSRFQRHQIKWACCDMSETYIGAIKDHCPKAKLVLDRFHIVKNLNAAVDEVRKEEWRKVKGDKAQMRALKGLRWLIFRHHSKRSKHDKLVIEALRKGNRRIHRACVLKDEFDHFWNYKAQWAARRYLKRWGTTALKSRLEPIRKFVHTIREHTENIITFIGSRLTNAIAEGINRIIGIVRNRASGFRTVEAFIDLIYLTVGDVDIPAQIPAKFRTL